MLKFSLANQLTDQNKHAETSDPPIFVQIGSSKSELVPIIFNFSILVKGDAITA